MSDKSKLAAILEDEGLVRTGIKTSGNHKRQVNVILDAEDGTFKGASDVER